MKTIPSLLLFIVSFGNLHAGIVASISQAMLSDESDIVIVSRVNALDITLAGNRDVNFPELLEERRKGRGKALLLYNVEQSVKGHLAGIVFFVQGEERTRNPHTGVHAFLPGPGTVWIAVASKNKVQNVSGATAATFLDVIDGVGEVTDGRINSEAADDIINDLKTIAAHLGKGEKFVLKTQFARSVADRFLKATHTEGAAR